MANTNSPYIAKNAGPLVNPTTAALFLQMGSPIATVATTQVLRPAYIKYAVYAQGGGAGTSNNINYAKVTVRAGGRVQAAASTTFTPSLVIFTGPATNAAPPTQASGYTVLGSLTPATFASNGQWTIDATLVWDYVTGTVAGTFNGNETPAGGAPVITASGAVTPGTGYQVIAPLTTLPTTAAQAAAQVNNGGEGFLFFGVTGLVGTGNAGTQAFLDNFEVEVL